MEKFLQAQTILDPIPESRDVGIGDFSSSINFRRNESDYSEVRDHSWFTRRTDPDEFKVSGGIVYGDNGTSATVEPITFNDPESERKVWVKITVTEDTKDVQSAVIETGATVPADTTTLIYWQVAELFDVYEGEGEAYFGANQRYNSDIYLVEGGGGGANVNHPWRVFMGTDDDELGNREFSVIGGDIYGDGGPITVADTTVNLNYGYVWVKVTRNSTSRIMTDAVIDSGPSVPASDYSEQCRAIAFVDKTASPPVLQLQFEEIRIMELLIVSNGEFSLVSLDMFAKNKYDTPP